MTPPGPTQTLLAAIDEALAPYAGILDQALAEGRLTSLTVELKIGTKAGSVRDVVVAPVLRRERGVPALSG